MNDISLALHAGSYLLASESASSHINTLLATRLAKYYQTIGDSQHVDENEALESLQVKTAEACLQVIESVQNALESDSHKQEDQSVSAPLIGTRDLAQLRTLLSITFEWGAEPSFTRLTQSWKAQERAVGSELADFRQLSRLICRILSLLFPEDKPPQMTSSLITKTIIARHISDILKPAIALGWLPGALATGEVVPVHQIRPMIMYLLSNLPSSESITALGSVMLTSCPRHVARTCGSLLSRQLLRPDGLHGLFAAIFGEGESQTETPNLEKLERISKVLCAVPSGMKPIEYFNTVVPRLAQFLSASSSTNRQIAAFSLSWMLRSDEVSPHRSVVSEVLLPSLHDPIKQVTSMKLPTSLTPNVVLTMLMTLTTNTDPSPHFLSTILSPIIPHLYSLLYHVDHIKTSEPVTKELVKGLLMTWARVVSESEGVNILWYILDGAVFPWRTSLNGQLVRVQKSEVTDELLLFTPQRLAEAEKSGDLNMESNLFNLFPDPSHFVEFLKSIHRDEISSAIFVRLLQTYGELQGNQEGDPKKSLLHLQMIMKMQSELANTSSSSNILKRPTHILAFVKHALESSVEPNRDPRTRSKAVDSDEEDSDDDMPDSEKFSFEDEMAETSINLLLSVLEVNEDMSARTAPVLENIFDLLEPLTQNAPLAIQSLAREAKMVMIARLASTSAIPGPKHQDHQEDQFQATYQKALKLLQDPLLPVRGHGLLLLRQLVSVNPSGSHSKEKSIDPALIPAILTIFLHSVQDDDSYLFLNAVQGLAAMVDTHGKEVLRGLVQDYSKGLDNLASPSQHELDVRLRIGEALALVIRRCGSALPLYSDILVLPLLHITHSSYLPTLLRSSSLSLLADCESTYPLTLLPHLVDLWEGMVDLIQVEMVPVARGSTDNGPTIDSDPTSKNTKFPPLRRAALHLLSLLIRETIRQIYDESYVVPSVIRDQTLKRTRTTLAYAAATDADEIFRVMAREAGDLLFQLAQAVVGVV